MIKQLQEQVQLKKKKVAPKPRFSFKRSEKSLADKAAIQESEVQTQDSHQSQKLRPIQINRSTVIHDKLSEFVIVETLECNDVQLININNSIIQLNTKAISSMHLKQLKDSIILVKQPILGSVLVENCDNVTFMVASCQQYRMHTSKNCRILLNVKSNPIIEDCHGILFGFYNVSDSHLHNQVQDFNWIMNQEKSPNWSEMLLKENEKLLKKLLNLNSVTDLESLNKFN